MAAWEALVFFWCGVLVLEVGQVVKLQGAHLHLARVGKRLCFAGCLGQPLGGEGCNPWCVQHGRPGSFEPV